MRLTHRQREIIRQAAYRYLGDKARVYLFGSRTDDNRRGGDVDLLIEIDQSESIMANIELGAYLEQALDLPVDILIHEQNKPYSAFQNIAKSQALPV